MHQQKPDFKVQFGRKTLNVWVDDSNKVTHIGLVGLFHKLPLEATTFLTVANKIRLQKIVNSMAILSTTPPNVSPV